MLDQSGRVLLRDGSAASKLRMGVTTLIAGEGGTAVPAGEIAGYFSKLEQQGIAVNFGTYYGAIQARVKVMGDAAGAPNEDQLRADRQSVVSGKSVSLRVDLGGRRIIKKKTYQTIDKNQNVTIDNKQK